MPKLEITVGGHNVGKQLPDGSIEWTSVENASFSFAIESVPDDPADRKAKEILANALRSSPLLPHIQQRLAAMIFAKSKLDAYLQTPIGDFQVKHEPTELNSLWAAYLMEGRQLIDKLGDSIQSLFSLKQRTNGLNVDKFSSLRKIISQEKNNQMSTPLIQILNKFEPNISLFIWLRNQEKKFKNTIKQYPKVMPDGDIIDGTIELRADPPQVPARDMPFKSYVQESYDTLVEFTQELVGRLPANF